MRLGAARERACRPAGAPAARRRPRRRSAAPACSLGLPQRRVGTCVSCLWPPQPARERAETGHVWVAETL